ncbi:MAG: hypothetical protein LBD23_01400 [Oscillospiraceae bacterium]|nr:hypothetical protein [Oscillospiraceae bacterium]
MTAARQSVKPNPNNPVVRIDRHDNVNDTMILQPSLTTSEGVARSDGGELLRYYACIDFYKNNVAIPRQL